MCFPDVNPRWKDENPYPAYGPISEHYAWLEREAELNEAAGKAIEAENAMVEAYLEQKRKRREELKATIIGVLKLFLWLILIAVIIYLLCKYKWFRIVFVITWILLGGITGGWRRYRRWDDLF